MYIYFLWIRHMFSLTTKVGMILTEGEALSFFHQGVDWTAARKTSATSLVGRKFSIGFEERSSASFSYKFFLRASPTFLTFFSRERSFRLASFDLKDRRCKWSTGTLDKVSRSFHRSDMLFHKVDPPNIQIFRRLLAI